MDHIKKAIDALKLNVLSIQPVEESFSSTVRILKLQNGQKVVIKIPFTRIKLFREKKVLDLLSDNPLVPNVLDVWEGDESCVGALLLSYIDGKPLVLPAVDSVIYEMGKALARLHTVKMDRFELDEVEEDWWLSVRNMIEKWVSEIENSLSEPMRFKIYKYLNENIMKLDKVGEPCLVHFDYRPGNILVREGRLVGVIDFESSRGGSAGIDFTKVSKQIWHEYPSSKNIFISGYQSIRELPNLEEVLPIYTFYNAIGGITWCVRRNKCNDSFFYENFEALESLLTNI